MRKNRVLTIIILICFLVAAPVYIIAGSVSFQISHAINVAASYHFEFWKYRTSEQIPNYTVNYNSAGEYGLATLAIAYNSNVRVSRLDIEVTDLVNTEDETQFCDFVFKIYRRLISIISSFFHKQAEKPACFVL